MISLKTAEETAPDEMDCYQIYYGSLKKDGHLKEQVKKKLKTNNFWSNLCGKL